MPFNIGLFEKMFPNNGYCRMCITTYFALIFVYNRFVPLLLAEILKGMRIYNNDEIFEILFW